MKKRNIVLAGAITALLAIACTGCSGNSGNAGNNDGNDGGNTDGTETNGEVIETDFGVVNIPGKLTTVDDRASVHDPSIEYDPATGQWYIFGSHTAFAKTSNLINWSYIEYEADPIQSMARFLLNQENGQQRVVQVII